MHHGRRVSHFLGVRGTALYLRVDRWKGVVNDSRVPYKNFSAEGLLIDLNMGELLL